MYIKSYMFLYVLCWENDTIFLYIFCIVLYTICCSFANESVLLEHKNNKHILFKHDNKRKMKKYKNSLYFSTYNCVFFCCCCMFIFQPITRICISVYNKVCTILWCIVYFVPYLQHYSLVYVLNSSNCYCSTVNDASLRNTRRQKAIKI